MASPRHPQPMQVRNPPSFAVTLALPWRSSWKWQRMVLHDSRSGGRSSHP